MTLRLCISFLFLLLATLVANEQSHAREDWTQLFNGKNLDGWIPKILGHETGVNFGNTFRVRNGVMQVGYEAYEGPFNSRFGHIFYERPFSHYRLVAEYRFIGDQVQGGPSWAFRNSGIMLHSQPPESMRRDQTFPISIEVQLLGGDGKRERTTMNLCTPGTHVAKAEEQTVPFFPRMQRQLRWRLGQDSSVASGNPQRRTRAKADRKGQS